MGIQSSPRLEYADIEWRDGAPYSRTFEDVYFQIENGIQESRYVFLEASGALRKISEDTKSRSPLTIIETGFGSGLNFLTTYQAWLSAPSPKRPVEFISFEAYPMAPDDIEKSHELWPDLRDLSKQLRDQYPLPIKGSHTLELAGGAFKLTLVFGELEQCLTQHRFNADIWYLDGFAPSKNQTMWADVLFKFMGKHSKSHATVSTFTAAGFVKRGLEEAGFKVTKLKGFGKKREMLSGLFQAKRRFPALENSPPLWHIPSNPTSPQNKGPISTDSENAIVVGAGLSGLSTALALADRGIRVELIEQAPHATMGGSSQPQLITYAKFPALPNQEARFTIASKLFSQAFFSREQVKSKKLFWHDCGVLHLDWNNKEYELHERTLRTFNFPISYCHKLSADDCNTVSGIPCNVGGLYFPSAGRLTPHLFATHVLQHPLISSQFGIKALALEHCKTSNYRWTVQTENREFSADNVILCSAHESPNLIPHLASLIKPLRGQTTQLDCDGLIKPKVVVCGNGYLCPSDDDEVHLGATYDLKNHNSDYLEDDNLRNIEALVKWLPDWTTEDRLKKNINGGKAGQRCTTRDYIPLIGPMQDQLKMEEEFSSLRKNAKKGLNKFGVYYPGLYLNIGHGSKGSITTPLAAEYLADLITHKPIKVSEEYRMMVSPARFLIRDLKKNA